MYAHKLKVYLKEYRGSEMINGHYFYAAYTQWTFLEATIEQMKVRPISEEGAYRHFSGCRPAKGERWRLSEISACVLESDVDMPDGYEVYKRSIWKVPVYPSYPAPEALPPEEVKERFPLAATWGGVMIGAIEYILKDGRLTRKHQNMSKSRPADEVLEYVDEEVVAA